ESRLGGRLRLHARRSRTDAHGFSGSRRVLRSRQIRIRRSQRTGRSDASRTTSVVRILRARGHSGARVAGGLVTTSGPIRLKLAVRMLAQLTCRRGDIHFRFEEATESQEGIALQKKLQRDRPQSYQREGAVATTWCISLCGVEVELMLAGRADGWDR